MFFKHSIHTYEEHTHKAFPQVPVEVPVDNCNNGNLGFCNVYPNNFDRFERNARNH